MTKHKITILLLIMLIAFKAKANEYDNEYSKFSIEIPNDWTISEQNDECLIFIKENKSILVQSFKADKKKYYNFKRVLDKKDSMAPKDSELISVEYPPFYNLLRNEIVTLYKTKDGSYIKQIFRMRYNTLFFIRMVNIDNSFKEEDSIIQTMNIKHTLKGNYHRMKDNLGDLLIALLTALFPFLGYLTRKSYDQYKMYRKIKLLPGYIILNITLFCMIFISLKDDLILMSIVLALAIFFWYSFFKISSFLKDIYDSMIK